MSDVNWMGAPGAEPLAFRALPSLSLRRYTKKRYSNVCGCSGCRSVHWAWLADNSWVAFVKHSTGITSACIADDVDADPGWAEKYLADRWRDALTRHEERR